jgi:predicted Rossmann fold flavoprotein
MRDENPHEVVIVGAGAAGLATAIFAAEALGGARGRIHVVDGARRLGAKILVSGGGRCNVTHHRVRCQDYHGHRVLVRNVLAALPVERTVAWFAGLGVELVEEDTGKLFPVTNSARTVLDALLARCSELGVQVRAAQRVSSVSRPADGGAFSLQIDGARLAATRVVLATGGRSLPRSGSDGTGWKIAESLGHSLTAPVPALVPLLLEEGFIHRGLSGVSCRALLTTRVDGRVVDRRSGSLLWTHFGVSGPLVLDASRFYTRARQAGRNVTVSLGFTPACDVGELDRELVGLVAAAPRVSVKRLVCGFVPERLGEALCALADVDAGMQCARLSKRARRALAAKLVDLALPVVGDRGWDHAEVTAGGVPLDEVDYRTMQSRRTPGLYLVGEMLDCDGRIGGFNFQWAWATGFVAGSAVAADL